MEKKSYSREKAKYYIDIMNSLENHGIQHVQQIHDALNEMDYDDDDHVDDDHVTNGNILMDFNTEGMYRGYKKSDGESEISIYK